MDKKFFANKEGLSPLWFSVFSGHPNCKHWGQSIKCLQKWDDLFAENAFQLEQSKPGRVPKNWVGVEKGHKTDNVALAEQRQSVTKRVRGSQQKLSLIHADLELLSVRATHLKRKMDYKELYGHIPSEPGP